MQERFRDLFLPTTGGIGGSLCSVNMGNILDTIILAAFGAAVGILVNEFWKLIKKYCHERIKRKN